MSIKSRKLVSVENEKIISVEKGNIGNVPSSRTVIALSVKGEGNQKSTKAILKGDLAYNIYSMFLANGNSISSDDISSSEENVYISKFVTVSFIGFVKEERDNEVVLTECGDFKFNFLYEIDEA